MGGLALLAFLWFLHLCRVQWLVYGSVALGAGSYSAGVELAPTA